MSKKTTPSDQRRRAARLAKFGPSVGSLVAGSIGALQAEADRLRADRDYWRENAGLHQIASAAYKNSAARAETLTVLKARIAKLESVPTYRIEPVDIDQLIAEQDEEESRGGI